VWPTADRRGDLLWRHDSGGTRPFPFVRTLRPSLAAWSSCPHRARAVSDVRGAEDGERITTIRTRLLAAYHDGRIELFYPRVFSYQLQSPLCVRGLGDWLYDEFTLSPDGRIIHEIEWAGFPDDEGSRWIIEATDIEFQWIPNDPA